MAVKYQTMEEFLKKPFGNSSDIAQTKYEPKYKKLENKIKVKGYLPADKYTLIHIAIPSESKENYFYDVVIQFFTDDEEVAKERNYEHYYMKFFSNSPSFIFTYAALYHLNGYLIDILLYKLDPVYATKLPKVRNPNMELFYDSSIYMACRYLTKHKLRFLTKFGNLLTVRKLNEEFFKAMKDFQDVKFDMTMFAVDRKIANMDYTNQQFVKSIGKPKSDEQTTERKRRNYSQDSGILYATKIKASSSTMKSKKVTTAKKIRATKPVARK